MPAVSVLNLASPNFTDTNPFSSAKVISSLLKSPSGPTRTVTDCCGGYNDLREGRFCDWQWAMNFKSLLMNFELKKEFKLLIGFNRGKKSRSDCFIEEINILFNLSGLILSRS